MSTADFEQFYLGVAEALLEEFDLWTGNEKLLASCMAEAGESEPSEAEPARIVLKKMRKKLTRQSGIFIIA
jgi:hypothetical protein